MAELGSQGKGKAAHLCFNFRNPLSRGKISLWLMADTVAFGSVVISWWEGVTEKAFTSWTGRNEKEYTV